MFQLNESSRREIKFKVFIKDIGKLYSWLNRESFKKSYDDRCVNSIYYDTPNLDFANDNISGQSKRIKIRVRWYSKIKENIFSDFIKTDKNFKFEIKRKFNRHSDKIVLPEIICSARNNINQRKNFLKQQLRLQLFNFKKLSSFILQDIVYVGYKREYYEHTLNPKLRFTIDKDIFCSLSNNFQNKKTINLSKDFLIAEIKIQEKDEKEIKDNLITLPFRQNRSSKYLYALSYLRRFNY